MISFIVIGKNEGRFIKDCFKAIYKSISYCDIRAFEVIYVDSKSSDNSIEIIQHNFKNVYIFKISGKANAAIARNIGAKEAAGNILYFIDGDMLIKENFLMYVLDEKQELQYPVISGQFINIYYDGKGNQIKQSVNFKNLNSDKFFVNNGGLFIIQKKYWQLVNGMKTKYRRCQDYDFFLRLAKKGIRVLRKKEIMAVHYCVDYFHSHRIMKFLVAGDFIYQKSVLARDHIFNKNIYPEIFRKFYSLLSLPIILLSSLLFDFIPYSIVAYILIHAFAIILRSISDANNIFNIFERVVFYFISDWISIFAFFVFFPREKDEEYIKVL